MTAFALGMGVAASIVKVPAIVGIFVAGMSFGGSEACRLSWDRNTCNLTHWLSRIFFTCSIGFIMPEGMVTMEAVLDGWEIASAAFFGSFIAGALGGLILLYKEKNPLPNVVMCGSAMAYCGEVRGSLKQHMLFPANACSCL
jgi:Kef-type K+ transport system membrane component KefB